MTSVYLPVWPELDENSYQGLSILILNFGEVTKRSTRKLTSSYFLHVL